jgi:TPR repeat protein
MVGVRRMVVSVATVLSLVAGAVQAREAGFERMKYLDYRNMVKEGHLAYSRGNFDSAFEKFTRNACGGDKDSQFALGTMYLMGEGVSPNALMAYAWYAVAAETGEADYRKSLDKLASAIPAEHMGSAKQMADDLMARYGERATRNYCEKRAEVGTRVMKMECKPNIDVQTRYVDVKMCEG